MRAILREMRRYTRHRRKHGAYGREDYDKLRRYTRHKHS
jgi:hypothetical protein